jgi:uncharacterized protein (DUF433 family)
MLSFNNLVEAFVLSSIRNVHGVSMQKVRKTLRWVGEKLRVERPLINARFRTDGLRLFVEHSDEIFDVTNAKQVLLQDVLTQSLDRIEWGKDVATRLYPWVRADRSAQQPRNIVVDPRRGFGQPVIVGSGVQARIVAQRYRSGESMQLLAEDYGLSVETIEDAVRCETREAA